MTSPSQTLSGLHAAATNCWPEPARSVEVDRGARLLATAWTLGEQQIQKTHQNIEGRFRRELFGKVQVQQKKSKDMIFIILGTGRLLMGKIPKK